ncbi:right-handed parallel beta-helix repeat-containing protein [Coleofasciculus sp. FACHB-64]|uniref:right-handed parallel beta-helix repeat-containing protein n=1 Tax=Cyanophyceae TaxID=3028117 RepID=UPI0016849E13|nr:MULTISPECIES: right-handed parallel beta-helix repeat-containing protein [unclassified Coleofasciculus]MBD1841440.1 right-handed parallel beta-helix repeat-containing protein [Coleofasciculus sp. FACHB-501]MBD2046379.1 right-handed parallel beta-helix repeat-containing protein [Coleofasciculus sp. FACHB-64]
MLLKISTLYLYTFLLLLGTLTSTAAAQTIEPKTNPSTETTDFTGVTILQLPDGISELNNKTLGVSLANTLDVAEHPPGALEPPALSFEDQKSLAKPSFYTLKEGRFLAQISNVETALPTPESSPKIIPSPETLEVEVPQPLAEVKTPPRTLHEAGLLQEAIIPENASPITEISADTKQTTQSERVRFQRFLPRIGAEFTTGPGVGYESSFGSIEGFVPLWQNSSNLTFLEGRLLLSTEDSHTSSNIVLGHRFYSAKDNRILGGYVAFDTRDTGNSNFNQVGAGFESLGENWDVRANAYIPVGDTRQLTQERVFSTGLSFSDPFFQGNFLGQTRNQQLQRDRNFEAAMAGFDVEAGVKIAQLGQTGDLRGYAGLYYYDAPGSSEILGWRTRLEARPTDTFRLGLLLSNDATFGTNLVLNVGANFPGTRPREIRKEDRVLARLGESVTRNANIVVDEQSESESFSVQDTVFVTNPATGQPWRFRHVNLGIGTGNGTFENPTATVAEALAVAQSNDIVYVQPGTNLGVPAFKIPDQVQVLSTGPVQRIDTVELGNLQLPLSNAGVLPDVTGTVTMGNMTTLSGFAISATTGSGIAGSNISNAIIRDNAIANSASEGILLENVTGQILIQDNAIANSALEGFSLSNNQGQVNLILVKNTIANNGALANEGDGINLELRNTATGTFNISENTITGSNSFGSIADGVEVKLFESASGTFTLTNNQITANQFSGINIELESNTLGTFEIANSTISGNQFDGISIKLNDSATGTFNITNTQISKNGFYGIGILLSNNTSGTFNITNSTIAENQDNGVNIALSDAAIGTVNISNNQQISKNGFYGIFTSINGNAQLQFLSESNQIIDNAFTGLSLNSYDTAKIFAGVRLNTITGSAIGDFEAITSGSGDTICLQPRNNTIGNFFLNDSFGGAIQIETGTLSTNNISVSDLNNWSGTTVSAGTCGFP